MKLRGKMLAMALIPICLLATIVCVFAGVKTTAAIKEQIFAGLQSAVYAEREAISVKDGNQFYVDEENGILYNGEGYDVTDDTTTPDLIKKETGIVLTVFYGDTRYMTSVTDENGKRVLYTQAGSGVIEKVLKGGQEYSAENVAVVGVPYYAYYIPLYNEGDSTPVGMVFAGKSQADAEATIRSIILALALCAVGLAVVAIVVVYVTSGNICKRIGKGINGLELLADGDLTIELDEHILGLKDETGDISRSVKNLRDKLLEIVTKIAENSEAVGEYATAVSEGAEETAGSIEQVDRAVNEIAEGATSQAADTTRATEAVITMGNLVEETNSSVSALTNVSNDMEESGKSAAETLKELEKINETAKESIDIIYDQTNTTNESAKKISEAINLITSIAEETNLLSLNASIEAARAGEQGRGFAVVASQISKLAEQSNESARKIEEIINSLMEDSAKAVTTMDEVKQIMDKQSEMVEKTAEEFGGVMDGINKSRDQITGISANMEGLNVSREGVVDIVSNLSAIAEENAASTEETSASATEVNATIQEMTANADHLQNIAKDLTESVKAFRF